jgi:hypothetical protein
VNVPKNTCNYFVDIPNYHYDSMPGTGPATGSITTLDGTITACIVDGVAGVIANNTCVGPEGEIAPGGGVSCTYNYTAMNPGVAGTQNCCSGTGRIVVTTRTTDPTSGGITQTVATATTNYGGTALNCLESPHDYIAGWPTLSTGTGSKAARLLVELANGSYGRTQKIPSSMSLFNSAKRAYSPSNFLNAGFHDWATYVASPSTWDTARTIPRAFQPKLDLGPTGDYVTSASAIPDAGDGSEEFRCLNAAGEVKHRIRMYVNEWNSVEDYAAYDAAKSPGSADPTVRGVVGVNCTAVNVGFSCNTIWGFEDMLNENGAGNAAYEFPEEWNRGTPP